MQPQITKIRAKSDGAKITYKLGSSSVVLSGSAPISDSFVAALVALESHVVGLLGFPAKYAEGLTVAGATFGNKGSNEFVVVVAKKALRQGGSPFNIVTPLRYMNEAETDDDATEEQKTAANGLCVDDVLRKKLENLRDEACKYILASPDQKQLYLPLEEQATGT